MIEAAPPVVPPVTPSGNPAARRWWSRPDTVQYALVCLNVTALVIGLFAAGRAERIATNTSEEIQEWATLLGHYGDLGEIAADTDEPGNDVFETEDTAGESRNFEATQQEFVRLVTRMRNDLGMTQIAGREAALDDLRAVSTGMDEMVRDGRSLFQHLRQHNEEKAHESMARMDRAYGRLSATVNRARRNVETRAVQLIRAEQRTIASLRLLEYLTAGFVLVMVAGAFVHGRRAAARAARYASEREQTLVELRRKEQQLHVAFTDAERQRDEASAIINATGDGLLLLDASRRCVSFNRRAAEFLGLTPEDLTDGVVTDIMLKVQPRTEDPNAYVARLEQHFADEVGQHEDVLVLVEPERRVLRRHSSPAWHAGQVVGRVFTYTDVTREAELDRVRADFVARASHELRTPLTSIHGALQLGLAGSADRLDAEDRELFEISVASTDRLMRLVNRMLDLSKVEAGRMPMERTPLAVSDVLHETLRAMQPEATGKNIRIDIRCADGMRRMFGDPDLLQRVLANLVNNAIKYSPAGTRITLGARGTPDDEIEVAVEDEGPGISDENIARLFQPFSRVGDQEHEHAGGTGLGLALSRAIVEQHGGRIWAERRSDRQGTRFVFTIPQAPASAPETAYATASAG